MIQTILGEMEFNTGFKCPGKLIYCGEEKNITIKLKAYFESDGITEAQVDAMKKYVDSFSKVWSLITDLSEEYDEEAKRRFVPKTLLFGRNGECALLCADNNEPDEGIAICIYPKAVIKSQDDYL